MARRVTQRERELIERAKRLSEEKKAKRRKPVTLLKPKHPPPLKTKMGAAPQVAKRRGRPPKMTTKPYGSDDNGDKATKPAAKAVPDAKLSQEQVDGAVNVVLQHPGGMGVSKPDELVRKIDANLHGYVYPPAEKAE
jgi:hypothetical protein